MESILIVCQTPYQIIVASKIVKTFYNDKKTDIIITNTINGGEELVARLNESNLFREVIYLKTKRINYKEKLDPVINYTNKFKEVNIKLKPYLKKYKYKKLLFCNTDVLIQHITNSLKKITDFEMLMFEDGLSSYSKSLGTFFENYNNTLGIKDKIQYELLRSQFLNINKFYVFNPNYLEWTPKFTVCEIPQIKKEDIKLISELNKIFMYEDLKKEYKHKYIFFEESYFADGHLVNDVELVDEVSKIVGKDNLFVKIHPRNPINRFKEQGYLTNDITSIPWEIIALNMHLEDKILITIASGSVINPLTIMGIDIKAIMLFKLQELRVQLLEGVIDITENICIKNPENYFIPENYSELSTYLQEI